MTIISAKIKLGQKYFLKIVRNVFNIISYKWEILWLDKGNSQMIIHLYFIAQGCIQVFSFRYGLFPENYARIFKSKNEKFQEFQSVICRMIAIWKNVCLLIVP